MRWTECLLYVWPSAHSPQRFGVPGGGPSDRGASVTFSLGSLGMKDLGVIKSRFHLKKFSPAAASLSLSATEILHLVESSDDPATSVPS